MNENRSEFLLKCNQFDMWVKLVELRLFRVLNEHCRELQLFFHVHPRFLQSGHAEIFQTVKFNIVIDVKRDVDDC